MAELSVLLVHAGLVAGQHHHLADLGHGAQDLVKSGSQPRHAIAQPAGDKLSLAHAEHFCASRARIPGVEFLAASASRSAARLRRGPKFPLTKRSIGFVEGLDRFGPSDSFMAIGNG